MKKTIPVLLLCIVLGLCLDLRLTPTDKSKSPTQLYAGVMDDPTHRDSRNRPSDHALGGGGRPTEHALGGGGRPTDYYVNYTMNALFSLVAAIGLLVFAAIYYLNPAPNEQSRSLQLKAVALILISGLGMLIMTAFLT